MQIKDRETTLSQFVAIGLLQQTITWYKIRHAGGQAHCYSRTGTLTQRDLQGRIQKIQEEGAECLPRPNENSTFSGHAANSIVLVFVMQN